MFGFGTLSDILSTLAWPLVGLLIIVVLFFAALSYSGMTRSRRLKKERAGEDVDSFVLFLSSYGFDPEIARTTYEYLTTEEDVTFPVRHTDRLDYDLRISDEEIYRMVNALLRAFGREQVLDTQISALHTVEDLLRYIQASPLVGAISGSSSRARVTRYLAGSGQYQTVSRQFRSRTGAGISSAHIAAAQPQPDSLKRSFSDEVDRVMGENLREDEQQERSA